MCLASRGQRKRKPEHREIRSYSGAAEQRKGVSRWRFRRQRLRTFQRGTVLTCVCSSGYRKPVAHVWASRHVGDDHGDEFRGGARFERGNVQRNDCNTGELERNNNRGASAKWSHHGERSGDGVRYW
jgi:hypothetical protein